MTGPRWTHGQLIDLAVDLAERSTLPAAMVDGSMQWEDATGKERTRLRRLLDGWNDADSGRRRLAAALSKQHATVIDGEPLTGEPVEGADYRRAVREIELHGCTLEVDGRKLRPEWVADPQRAALALARCSSAWGIHWSGAGWGEHPLSCTSSLCPACVRRSARQRAETWRPVFRYLAAAGYTIAFVTATQRTREGEPQLEPVVLSSWEREHLAYRGAVAPAGGSGRSTPGESLGRAIDRVSSAWRLLRDGAASRQWWKDTVAGGLYGLEVTGCRPRRRSDLRWHAHVHAILLLRPGVDLDRWSWNYISRWCEVADATPGAQDIQFLDPDTVEDRIVEVLKYPVKVGQLTDAQVGDWLASTKGKHFHGRIGSLHSSSRVGRIATWLAKDDPDLGLLGERIAALNALGDDLDIEQLCAAMNQADRVLHRESLSQKEYLRRLHGYHLLDEGEQGMARDLARALIERPQRAALCRVFRHPTQAEIDAHGGDEEAARRPLLRRQVAELVLAMEDGRRSPTELLQLHLHGDEHGWTSTTADPLEILDGIAGLDRRSVLLLTRGSKPDTSPADLAEQHHSEEVNYEHKPP